MAISMECALCYWISWNTKSNIQIPLNFSQLFGFHGLDNIFIFGCNLSFSLSNNKKMLLHSGNSLKVARQWRKIKINISHRSNKWWKFWKTDKNRVNARNRKRNMHRKENIHSMSKQLVWIEIVVGICERGWWTTSCVIHCLCHLPIHTFYLFI